MPQSPQYALSTADRIMDLLKDPDTGLGSFFSNFFYGPMDEIKTSSLPCVIVQEDTTRVTHSATGMDELTERFTIKLAINAKAELGKNPNEVPGAKSLANWVKGIDQTSGEYEAHTVLGILRKYFSVNQSLVDQDIEIDFLSPELTDGRTMQAHVSFTAVGLKVVTGRR